MKCWLKAPRGPVFVTTCMTHLLPVKALSIDCNIFLMKRTALETNIYSYDVSWPRMVVFRDIS